MNSQVRARRDAALLTGGLVVISLFILLRCGGGPDPVSRPRRAVTTTVAVATTPAPAPITTAVTPSAPAGPPATTEEAAAVQPVTTPAPASTNDAGRVTVGFLRAWVLRADIDTRRHELAKWAVGDYAGTTAFADPDRLPPGERVEVESVELRGELGATVVAYVDGIKIQVDLVRTGRGYLAENHAPI